MSICWFFLNNKIIDQQINIIYYIFHLSNGAFQMRFMTSIGMEFTSGSGWKWMAVILSPPKTASSSFCFKHLNKIVHHFSTDVGSTGFVKKNGSNLSPANPPANTAPLLSASRGRRDIGTLAFQLLMAVLVAGKNFQFNQKNTEVNLQGDLSFDRMDFMRFGEMCVSQFVEM